MLVWKLSKICITAGKNLQHSSNINDKRQSSHLLDLEVTHSLCSISFCVVVLAIGIFGKGLFFFYFSAKIAQATLDKRLFTTRLIQKVKEDNNN